MVPLRSGMERLKIGLGLLKGTKVQHGVAARMLMPCMLLLLLLISHRDESVAVPTVIEMITMVYAPHSDWRVRYAAMLAIGTIAAGHFKGDMIRYLEQVVSLVLESLNELNHRVLWGTMHAIKCLSAYKEQLKQAQYHVKFLAKLVPIIKYSLSLCPCTASSRQKEIVVKPGFVAPVLA